MASTLATPTDTTPASPLAGPTDTLCINTIRTLAMDAVQAANSGHPGTPMAMAPVAYTSGRTIPALRPRTTPSGPNRDRFVLSIGHASMLLYTLLHLTGVKRRRARYETLGDARPSRSTTSSTSASWTARCPGHPEYRWTSGVETHHRPARPGRRHQRRHGDRVQVAGRRPSTARLRRCSTTASTPSAATAT